MKRLFYLGLVIGLLFGGNVSADDRVHFGSQIKPILSDNCYYCHGPDAGQRSTDLRLDLKDSAFSDLGGYAAIVPGDVQASELVRRILTDDDDERMPPPDHRKKLSATQKELLVQWIAQGADWSEHWAFQPPVQPVDPVVTNRDWPINFIDDYVLARLEQEDIQPSSPAEWRTQLRRLSFDLIGLSPSLEQLRQYSGARDTPSYEQIVDRLLASPHFGERMAIYWLDLVRYADSVGYHGDQPISVSPYRDYVIDAFNQNMPFDRFTREQLAGDLLEKPTRNQLVASGYNRLGMMSAEGGVQPEEYLNKYASDRVRTTASVWLGVTLGCAECHDHKFDPFLTREFYEFSAFFADIKERGLYDGAHQSGKWGPSIEVPDEQLPDLLRPIDADIQLLQQTLVETPDILRARLAWEQKVRHQNFNWQPLPPSSFDSVHKVTSQINEDHSVSIGGDNPNENCYVITADVDHDARAFRLEVLPDATLPKQGPGRAGNGNFVVSEFIAVGGDHAGKRDELKKAVGQWPDELKSQVIALHQATATIEQTAGGERHPDKKWSAASAIDQDQHGRSWGWAVLPAVGKPNEWVAQIAGDSKADGTVTFVIQQYHGQGSHTLGRFRLSSSPVADAVANPFHGLPLEVKVAIDLPRGDRTAEQDKTIADHYLSIAPQLAEARNKLEQLKQQRQQVVDAHTRTSPITVSVPPREIRVLPRGNWMDKSGDIVQPNVPRSLGGKNWTGPATRLQLADWMVDRRNPLTARVFVNRLWRMFFGNGLSPVLDDLGAQGQPPTHPDLLDRLAIEFMESGWDIKHMVRLIVTSQTYRQSSSLRPDLADIDPENRLLARQTRFRLDAELIRDQALHVSGLLVTRIGGRSANPYQPAGLYRHLNFPTRKYQASVGDAQYRRGVYTHWQRQYLHPAMKTFDAPPREECTAARPRSSTPLAALVLLNDPSYVEAARAFADRVLEQDGSNNEKMNWIFLTAFSRPISDDESKLLQKLLHEHLAFFGEHPEQAQQLLSVGQSTSMSAAPPDERAAWTSVCRAVINMHEFILRK